MIAHLKGIVSEKLDSSAIIDVNGVGYHVYIPAPDLEQLLLDENVKLYTYFAVRETAQELYGFSSHTAKELFQQLISVNGVGPKAGLAILSLGEVDHIKHAIADGNVAYITAAQGVGKKGAEKVILDLKDKVIALGESFGGAPSSSDDAVAALQALGYSMQHIQQALSRIDKDLPTEQRVKEALKEVAS